LAFHVAEARDLYPWQQRPSVRDALILALLIELGFKDLPGLRTINRLANGIAGNPDKYRHIQQAQPAPKSA
jgi:hypothetical protein